MDWFDSLLEDYDYFGYSQPTLASANNLEGFDSSQPTLASANNLDLTSALSNYAFDFSEPMSETDMTGNIGTDMDMSYEGTPTSPNLVQANTPSPSGVGMVMGANDQQNKTLGSSVLDSLGGQKGMALAGILSNLAGNYLNKQATQKGQSNYLKNVTWTPQRTENYMNALRNNVTSLYGNAAQGANKAMSASNAIRGTGGGAFGRKSEQIGREMRSNIAQSMNQGALTTNTPPNLPQSAFTNTSPVGDTLTGIGGQIGNAQANKYLLEMLNLLQNGNR